MKRITLDIDYKSPFRVSEVLTKIFLKVERIKLIEIKPSFKKGYHFIIWTTENYSLEEIFKLREDLGDDKTRVRLDRKRRFGRQTLFNKKRNFKNPKLKKPEPYYEAIL